MPYVGLQQNLVNVPQEGKDFLAIIYEGIFKYDDRQKLFVNRPVKEIVFGYLDPVLDWAHENIPAAASINPFYTGFITNRTLDDDFAANKSNTIYTGAGNIQDIRRYIEFQSTTFAEVTHYAVAS